jgi:CheY-like chemotaxis protein
MSTTTNNTCRGRVLIVEDEPATSEGWALELGDRDIFSEIAADPDEAVRRLKGTKFAAVILDLMLPTGNRANISSRYDVGVEILQDIRANRFGETGTGPDTPVIVVTAVADGTVIERLKALNVTHIYTKPEHPRVLAEHIRILMERRTS